jgi:sugar phosphate isomerase/epimerase
MNPVEVIRMLGGDVIKHVHAKDVRIDSQVTSRIGVLDTKHYGDEINRAWVFRTLGYGHGPMEWNDMISMLRLVGYDGVLSIEHEDSVMNAGEGLTKAVQFLKGCLIAQPRGEITWA